MKSLHCYASGYTEVIEMKKGWQETVRDWVKSLELDKGEVLKMWISEKGQLLVTGNPKPDKIIII